MTVAADRDQHRPQAHDAGVEQRLLERLALLVRSSMKSKSTMMWLTMTPIRLAMPRNAMKPNGDAHDPQRGQRADHAVRDRGEHDQRLDRVPELDHQRQEDHHDRDHHDDGQVAEALDLFLVLAADLQS